MKKIKMMVSTMAVMILLFSTVSAAEAELASGPVSLRPVTLGAGSGVYQQWSVIREYLRKTLPPGSNVDLVPASKGYPMTIAMISAGKGEISTVAEPSTVWAWKGVVVERFKKKRVTNIRAMIKLPKTSWILFFIDPRVAKKYNISSVGDVIRKKVPIKLATWPRGSFSDVSVRLALKEYGVSVEDFQSWGGKIFYGGPKDIVSYMKNKVANAYFGMCIGLKYAPIMNILASRKLLLLPIDEEKVKSLAAKYGYTLAVVPKGNYGGVQDTPAIAMDDVIIVRSDVPNNVVYTVTKIIIENIGEISKVATGFQNFDLKEAPKTFIPLHPGAKRYYVEAGAM